MTRATTSVHPPVVAEPTDPLVERLRARAGRVRHPRLLEAAIVATLLGFLAGVVYGPHAIHGGFISDGWSIRTMYVFAPADDLLGRLDYMLSQPNVSPRPLHGVYLALQNAVFGDHMGFWLAWQGALGVLMSLMLYLLLRELRIRTADAGVVAVLVLIFPAASSIRFWTAPVSQLTISLALLGFVLALRAFDSTGRRGAVLHGLSLAAFIASLLLYEIGLSAMLVSVLLYRLRVPWAKATKRWLVDCAALIPIAALVTRSESSSWETQTTGGMWEHAKVFWDQAQTLFTSIVLPLGSDRWYVLALTTLVPLAAILVMRQLRPADPARAELRRWLLAVLGGLVVVTVGYAMFVPAMDYYTPLGAGIANRINAVPSIGWVLVVYGLLMLAATMAFRGLTQARLAASALTLLATAVLATSWLESVDRDADNYMRAYAEGQRVLAAVGKALPDPPPDSTIWTFGQPVEIAPGVPVFGNPWDMTSSVQLMYDDPTLASYVGQPGTEFDCRRDSIVPSGPAYTFTDPTQANAAISQYGRTYFVDTVSGRWELIDDAAQCRRASQTFQRSPALPPVPA